MRDFIKDKLHNKKIIVIWLWKQWKKIVNFFISLWLVDNIIWICKTIETKEYCEKKFNIYISLDLDLVINKYGSDVWFIFIWVMPDDVQDEIYIKTNNIFTNVPILIEKSFISESSLNKINMNHFTWIIVEEYSYLPFFIKIKEIRDNIKEINIIVNLNEATYSEILKKELSFMSYIYWYIYILDISNIKVIKISKLDWKAKVLLLINWHIIINIILKRTDNVYNFNSIIYKDINNNKFIFNANSKYFLFNWNKFLNNSLNWYFDVFLENKIGKLLNKDIILKSELIKINKFNSINLFDKNILI